MDKRREFPAKIKVAAFERANGSCEKCSARLSIGKFVYDHINPDWMGGEPTLTNCQVLCAACDKPKTRKDHADIAKSQRVRARYLGIKTRRHRWGYGRCEKFKRKISGEIVRRNA